MALRAGRRHGARASRHERVVDARTDSGADGHANNRDRDGDGHSANRDRDRDADIDPGQRSGARDMDLGNEKDVGRADEAGKGKTGARKGPKGMRDRR